MKEPRERLSPFEYVPGLELIEEFSQDKKSDISLEVLFKTKHYGRVEYVLLESLFFYPVLLRNNMEQFADNRLKDKKRDNYQNIIKRLWKEGQIRRLRYGDTRLYILSDSTRAYMEKKLNPTHKLLRPEGTPAAILECASLAQWHMSLLSERYVKSYFFQEVKYKNEDIIVPSYIELKKKGRIYKVNSFSVPKEEKQFEALLKVLDNLHKKFHKPTFTTSDLKKDIQLIVFVSQTIQEMERLSKIMAKLSLTEKWPIYFVLETNTVFTNGLSNLYQVNIRGEKIITKTITVQ